MLALELIFAVAKYILLKYLIYLNILLVFPGSYDKCLTALQEKYKDDSSTVAAIIFSHSQVSRASSRLCWVERCNRACLVQSVKGLSPAYQIFNQYHEFLQDFVLYEFALMFCKLVLCTGQQPMETDKTRKTGYPSF